MTRRDYEILARAIYRTDQRHEAIIGPTSAIEYRELLLNQLCDDLVAENPRFNVDIFRTACAA